MTPALKAMVEAMAAEIERQTDGEVHLGDDGKTAVPGKFAGDFPFDLEKVARAGLEALRDLDSNGLMDLILAGAEMEDSVGHWWPVLIDAILKDQP